MTIQNTEIVPLWEAVQGAKRTQKQGNNLGGSEGLWRNDI